MNSEDGQVYTVCILQFACFSKYNRMQSKHKQTKNVNKADETLADDSFLSRNQPITRRGLLHLDLKILQ